MSEEKKVNAAEEEAKKDVKVEENSEKLTDEEMSKVNAGAELVRSFSPKEVLVL